MSARRNTTSEMRLKFDLIISPSATAAMSDSEQDASILGKRARKGEDGQDEDMEGNAPAANQEEEDDDDDDVGPMPMPAEAAANGGIKKKRKGMVISTVYHLG